MSFNIYLKLLPYKFYYLVVGVIETVETCLEKCDSGNGITEVERNTIEQIENQFCGIKEPPIRTRLKHLQGKLQENFEAIFRLYASAYPR